MLKIAKELNLSPRELSKLFFRSYRTIQLWIRNFRLYGFRGLEDRSPRPYTSPKATPDYIKELIIRIYRENLWGYAKIEGALKDTGYKISPMTIKKILQNAGLIPPPRKKGTYKRIEPTEPDQVWSMDLTRITIFKMIKIHILAIVDNYSRSIKTLTCSFRATSQWVKNEVSKALEDNKVPQYFYMDNDVRFQTKYKSHLSTELGELLERHSVTPKYIPKGSPWYNGCVERFFRSLKEELLRKLPVFGRKQLTYYLLEYQRYFNNYRVHQGIAQRIPHDLDRKIIGKILPPLTPHDKVERIKFLGGILNGYAVRRCA